LIFSLRLKAISGTLTLICEYRRSGETCQYNELNFRLSARLFAASQKKRLRWKFQRFLFYVAAFPSAFCPSSHAAWTSGGICRIIPFAIFSITLKFICHLLLLAFILIPLVWKYYVQFSNFIVRMSTAMVDFQFFV